MAGCAVAAAMRKRLAGNDQNSVDGRCEDISRVENVRSQHLVIIVVNASMNGDGSEVRVEVGVESGNRNDQAVTWKARTPK